MFRKSNESFAKKSKPRWKTQRRFFRLTKAFFVCKPYQIAPSIKALVLLAQKLQLDFRNSITIAVAAIILCSVRVLY